MKWFAKLRWSARTLTKENSYKGLVVVALSKLSLNNIHYEFIIHKTSMEPFKNFKTLYAVSVAQTALVYSDY